MEKVKDSPGLEEICQFFPSPSSALVSNVSMKLPAFWPDAAKVWFTQVDAQFSIRSITVSKTKLYHMVAFLPQEVAFQILDLIQAPPPGDPYEVLRERFIRLYSLNDYQRFAALVSLPLNGDQKPLHLMNQMMALLLDGYKPDFILPGLFLQRLSIHVCSHLLQEKVSDPRAVALKADKLYQSKVSSSMNLLTDVLEDSLQVNAVTSGSRPSRPPTLAKRSSTPAPSLRSPTSPGPCWYHKKHGVLLRLGKLVVCNGN